MSHPPNLSTAAVQLVPSAEWVPDRGLFYVISIVSGGAYWIGTDRNVSLCSGAGMLILGEAGVRLVSRKDEGVYFYWFVVRLESLTGLLSIQDRLALQDVAHRQFSGIHLKPEDDLAKRALQILADSNSPAFLTRIRMLDLLLTVVSPLMKVASSSDSANDGRVRLRSLLSRLPESELLSLTVEECASKVGCSVRHFSRLFSEEVGISFRERQTEMRLLRASELLLQSNAKVIDIAFQCGYSHIGLFNSLFRRRFRMTPSSWRRQQRSKVRSPRRRSPLPGTVAVVASFLFGASLFGAQDTPPTLTPSASTVTTNVQPVRVIREFALDGNTLLPQETVDLVLADYVGLAITTNNVTQAVKALQMVYQGRGFATVSISVPRQSISNGVVRLAVVEGVLSEIRVQGNRWFSDENVRRALPSLHTNIILNSRVFQQELNNANNNLDRQIYPLIEPGATPGSTRLILKVKDHVPVHGRFELNNQYTPGTPELRGNASAQYNNLWQREHAIGLQYGFALQEFKDPAHSSLLDRPLIANYSGYYRLPLSSDPPVQPEIDANPRKFGYNEVTRQFVLPPSQGRTELVIYANRSTTDTGVKVNPVETINPPPIGLYSQESGQDVSTTEAVGFRVTKPLPEFLNVRSVFSAGADLKNFQRASFNTNNFLEQFTFLNPDTFETQTNSLPFSNVQPPRTAHVSYLPIAMRWDGARADTNGTTTLGMGVNFNFAGGPFSDSTEFATTAGTTNASGTYVTLLGSASRQQKLPGDWTLLVKADGQWANEPLISNEQFGMGGLAGVRGYLEGERYGDTGWRTTLEPRTPMVDVGMVDGTMPLRFQGAFFMDYGRSYSLNPHAPVHLQTLWGAGMGINAKIGATFDFRAAVAWALLDAQTTHAGAMQIYFAIAAQF